MMPNLSSNSWLWKVADKFLQLPKFHSDYSLWKSWTVVYSDKTLKGKQGISVCLTLEGEAKDVGLQINVDELSTETGLKNFDR